MTRLPRPALAVLLLLAVGCTFERRPAENGDAGGNAASPPAGVDTVTQDAPSPPDVERAGAFFQTFQDARRAGRISDARSRLHPRALLVHGTRRLSLDASDAELEGLLALEGRGAAPPPALDEVEPLPSGVLFLVRYPSAESADGTVVESVLVGRDTAGWSVRLLQRSVRPPD